MLVLEEGRGRGRGRKVEGEEEEGARTDLLIRKGIIGVGREKQSGGRKDVELERRRKKRKRMREGVASQEAFQLLERGEKVEGGEEEGGVTSQEALQKNVYLCFPTVLQVMT